MPLTLFTRPIKPGKTEVFKSFLRECFGPRKEEYKDLLLRYGLNTVQIWICSLDGIDYAVFTHEMNDNAAKLLEGWHSSQHPFDKWFDEQLSNCYDINDKDKTLSQAEFIGALDARD